MFQITLSDADTQLSKTKQNHMTNQPLFFWPLVVMFHPAITVSYPYREQVIKIPASLALQHFKQTTAFWKQTKHFFPTSSNQHCPGQSAFSSDGIRDIFLMWHLTVFFLLDPRASVTVPLANSTAEATGLDGRGSSGLGARGLNCMECNMGSMGRGSRFNAQHINDHNGSYH